MANTLTFANQTLTDADIYGGITFTADINSGDEFTIGNTSSACVSFVTDKQIPLYSKDSTNGKFTWTKDSTSRGTYYVTEVKKEDDMYTATAYDAMSLLEVNIQVLDLPFPITLSDAADAVATYIGHTVSGTIVNGALQVNELDPDMTVRQFLSFIAEASACSVKVDAADHLCFMYYADSGVTITASNYKKLSIADYTCAPIGSVVIVNSTGGIQASSGSAGNALYIGNNPFLDFATDANAAAILAVVEDYEYVPLTCELFTDDNIEVGTIVTFGSTPTLVMHVESNEGGAVASSVGTDSRTEYNKSIVSLVNETKALSVEAYSMSSVAHDLLESMQDAAAAANTTLTQIYQDAENAAQSASDAYAYADQAFNNAVLANESSHAAHTQLGIVENVFGVFELLIDHGTYQATADTEVQTEKWYFTRTGSGTSADPYRYHVVENPSGNPSTSGWYELTGIDEAIQNYVSSHLVLDDSGLWLQSNSGAKILLSATDGVMLFDENGFEVATYGSTTYIGNRYGFHIEIDGAEIGIYQGEGNKVAYFNTAQLYVENSLSFGSFSFIQRQNDHFTLKLLRSS